MQPATLSLVAETVEYPDSDGQPMAENTIQCDWIFLIKQGLDITFEHEVLVFIAVDNFWYPVRGEPSIRVAPDVYVVFGRPKGHRGSYRQWLEGGIPLSVAFEILSPGNTLAEMIAKLTFYDKHGVQEYYVYDPATNKLTIYVRRDGRLQEVAEPNGFVSPLMGIRFEMTEETMVIFDAQGRRFRSTLEREAQFRKASKRARTAELQRQAEQRRAEIAGAERLAERRRAEIAEVEKLAERRRAEIAEAESRTERERVEKLLALLRERGIESDIEGLG